MNPGPIDDGHDDFGGLHRDLAATRAAIDRRGLFRLAARFGAGIGALQLIGCASNPASPSESGGSSTGGGSCSARIPEETQGPFPADGSNGPSVLSLGGVVRGDIRSSFAGLNGTAAGVPLTIELTIVTATSQIALPKSAWDAAYATAGYESSIGNLSRVSLASDMVFSDGSALELATASGSVAGFTSSLTVAV